jgi:hypothetical protein
MIQRWRVIDVTDWSEELPDMRGRRAKTWLRAPDGVKWMKKEPAKSRPTEPQVETFALMLAADVGISAAEGFVCEWTSEGGGRRHGTLVRCFADGEVGDKLSSGSELLGGYSNTYDPENKNGQTPDLVYAALTAFDRRFGTRVLADFVRVLIFDAWIGNSDRHQSNWSIVKRPSVAPTLSPMYDPAGCLGAELLEPSVSGVDVDRYIDKCPSGFGDGCRILKHAELVQQLKLWPEWGPNLQPLLAQFQASMDTAERFLKSAAVKPALTQDRAELMVRLLHRRLEWLREAGC